MPHTTRVGPDSYTFSLIAAGRDQSSATARQLVASGAGAQVGVVIVQGGSGWSLW